MKTPQLPLTELTLNVPGCCIQTFPAHRGTPHCETIPTRNRNAG